MGLFSSIANVGSTLVNGVTKLAGGAVEAVANTAGNVVQGFAGSVGSLVGKGVGLIAGAAVGNFVGGVIKVGGKIIGGVVKGVGKAVSGIVKGAGKVIGGAINIIGKGVGGIVKGIGSFLGGLFGGGPSKEELRIARQAVEEVKRKIREQMRILEDEVHAPMSKMVQTIENGQSWRGDGANAFAAEVSSLHVPGAGRVRSSFDMLIDRLTRAVEIVEEMDKRNTAPINNWATSWRSIRSTLG